MLSHMSVRALAQHEKEFCLQAIPLGLLGDVDDDHKQGQRVGKHRASSKVRLDSLSENE